MPTHELVFLGAIAFCLISLLLGLLLFIRRKKQYSTPKPAVIPEEIPSLNQSVSSPSPLSLEETNDDLDELLETEASMLALKELYIKRLISAEKYVEETRRLAQKQFNY